MNSMRSDTPTIAVVIPAQNAQDSIGRAVLSAQAQDLQPLEIIVVDDASEDMTGQVARQMGARILRNEMAQGSGPARNRGIAAAESDLIAFLDADDEWDSNHLSTCLKHFDTRVALVASIARDSNGRLRGLTFPPGRDLEYRDLFFPENAVVTSGTVARRGSLIAAGLFREYGRAQDLDMWIRIKGQGALRSTNVPTLTYTSPTGEAADGKFHRSLSYAEQVLESYASEEWMTPKIVRATALRQNWDRFRLAARRRNWREAALLTALLVKDPRNLSSLAALLLHRLRVRRLSRAAGGPTVASPQTLRGNR